MSKTSYVPSPAKIKVIGMGGAGCNAITRMVREQIRGVEFIAMNTDAAHLEITEAPVRIALGEKLTRGLGAGGDHNVGRRSAEETRDEIKQAIAGADMVFLAAGMGGGTGTGSIAVVAEMAKQSGALTIATVTKPFAFEGSRRMQVAEEGISQLDHQSRYPDHRSRMIDYWSFPITRPALMALSRWPMKSCAMPCRPSLKSSPFPVWSTWILPISEPS